MKCSRSKGMKAVVVVTLFSASLAHAGKDGFDAPLLSGGQGQPHWQNRMPLPPVGHVQQQAGPLQQAPLPAQQSPFDPFGQVQGHQQAVVSPVQNQQAPQQNQQPYPLPPLSQNQGMPAPFNPFGMANQNQNLQQQPGLLPAQQMAQQPAQPFQPAVQQSAFQAPAHLPAPLQPQPVYYPQPYQGLQPPPPLASQPIQQQPIVQQVSAIPEYQRPTQQYQNPFDGADPMQAPCGALDDRLELQVAAAEIVRLHSLGQAEPYSLDQLKRFEHIAKHPGYQAPRPMNNDDFDAVATSSAVYRLRHLKTSAHLDRGMDSNLKFSADYFSNVLYNMHSNEEKLHYIRESFHAIPLLTHPELFRILSGISQKHQWEADHILRKKVIGRLDFYPFEYWVEWAGQVDPEVLNHHLKYRSKTAGFSGNQVVAMLEAAMEVSVHHKVHSEKPLLDLRDLLKQRDKREHVSSEWTATDLQEMRVSPKLAFAINLISKAREMTHAQRETTQSLLQEIVAKTEIRDLCEKPIKKKHMNYPQNRGVFAERVRTLGFDLLHRVPEQAQGALIEFEDDLIDSSDEELYVPAQKQLSPRFGHKNYQKL
jgi:hypothetical protein